MVESPLIQRILGSSISIERQQLAHCLSTSFPLPQSDEFGDVLQRMTEAEERAVNGSLEAV